MADSVVEFLSHHNLNLDEWPWGHALLAAFLTGREATSQTIAAAPKSILEKEPSFGLLYQLGERACEHIAGSIACFATKNAASAELAARAAVEISVNIRFMLAGDRNSRVVAWIRDYVRNDEKQINHWEKAMAYLSQAQRQQCVPRIATRRKLQELRKRWLEDAESEFARFGPVNLNEPWPKIVDRFDQIGEAVAYRTAYARLSSHWAATRPEDNTPAPVVAVGHFVQVGFSPLIRPFGFHLAVSHTGRSKWGQMPRKSPSRR